DAMVETTIDLSESLSGERGHLIVQIDFPQLNILRRDRYSQSVTSWVQVTQIGLDAFSDYEELVAWTTALEDGRPLEGVEVSFLGRDQTGVTAADGTVTLELPAGSTELLVARQGGDVAILPPNQTGYTYWGG